MTTEQAAPAFVPKVGDRVRIVELHPKWGPGHAVGQEFLIGGEGADGAGAWAAADTAWCVIKNQGTVTICRVERVHAAVFEVGDWVEWSAAGPRLVGRVRSVHLANVYCEDVSGAHLAEWRAPYAEVCPWMPQVGEWCEGAGIDSGEPYSGRFCAFVELGDKRGANLHEVQKSRTGVALVARASLRPAIPAREDPGSARAPQTHEGADTSEATRDDAKPAAPVTAPDPYAEHQRRLDEADRDPVAYERRRQWYAREDLRAQVLQMWATLPAKRHPSDWVPPDDFEVCK